MRGSPQYAYPAILRIVEATKLKESLEKDHSREEPKEV